MKQVIKEAYDRVHAAERERDALIREIYQTGDSVYYELGNRYVYAKVLGHSRDRLKVRGLSGKEYWIGAYRVADKA